MKNKIIGIISISMIMLMYSCNDFLDREPLDKVTPGLYFASEADLAAYAIKSYEFKSIGNGQYGISIFGDDNDTDNQATASGNNKWVPGLKKVQAKEGSWKFENVRSCNYFLEQVLPKYESGNILGNEANIRHYIGEMYVIRAYAYFEKLKALGDLPIVTDAYIDDEAILIEASKREPRNKVARQILKDLDTAIEYLLSTPPNGKNRISKNVAYLLKARVALYEGTFEKYHKGTALVPGGKGWPGDTKDIGDFNIDSEVNFFLDEALVASKIVGDVMQGGLSTNTGTHEGMQPDLTVLNPYYVMFSDANMEPYQEVLMWRQFRVGQISHNVQMELQRNGGGSGWTKGMVESFLMKNGLPIYASGSGYKGDMSMQDVITDRDSRLEIFTKIDGDVNYYIDKIANIYTKPLILNSSDTRAVTGYAVKKGKHYNGLYGQDHDRGESGCIVFRGVEALLIYLEASYERNGSLDGTATSYWKAIRKRARVDEDFNKTIAATDMSKEALGDWGAYSHNKLVEPTLYNIRRERRNELCAESSRWSDLVRWRACDQVKNYIIEGFRFWDTKYPAMFVNEDGSSQLVVDPTKGNVSPKENSLYLRPYQIVKDNNSYYNGYNFIEAHYLEPIAQEHFLHSSPDKNDLNKSIIYQNPGWSRISGQGAK